MVVFRKRIGADTAVHPEREMGARLTRGIIMSDVADYMSVTQGYGITKLPFPRASLTGSFPNSASGRKVNS
jgi:Trk K+ transport system NAD-binding subunit